MKDHVITSAVLPAVQDTIGCYHYPVHESGYIYINDENYNNMNNYKRNHCSKNDDSDD